MDSGRQRTVTVRINIFDGAIETLKQSILARFSLILLAFLAYTRAASAIDFKSDSAGFALSYPDTFDQVEVPVHNVALALRSRGSSFPTFNVIVDSSPPPNFKADIASVNKQLLEGYSRVGFPGVEVKNSEEVQLNGIHAFVSDLRYEVNRELMISRVVIVPAGERFYTLTFIDKAAAAENSLPAFRNIIASFKVLKAPETAPAGEYSYFVPLVSVTLVTLLVLILLRKLLRK